MKELLTQKSSHHTLIFMDWGGVGRGGRYVTFDFCFVNTWQRGAKLSSSVRGSHQTAPNMARWGRSAAAAYPPN